MADLKADQRQIAHPKAPNIAGAGEAFGAIGKAVNVVANTVADYDKAARSLDSSYIYGQTSNILNEMLVDSLHPTNIANTQNGNVLERYIRDSNALLERSLQEAPRGFHDELKLKLQSVMNNNALKIRSALQDHLVNKSKSSIESMIDGALLNMTDAIRAGDLTTAKQSRGEVLDLLDKGQQANFFNEKEVQTAKLKLNNAAIESEYTAMGESAAFESPGEVRKLEQSLADNDFGLTASESDIATAAAIRGAKKTEGLLSGSRKKQAEALEAKLAKLELAHEQFRVGGDQAKADKVELEMRGVVQALENLEALSEKESFNKQLGIGEQGILSRYFERGRRDARAEAGTVERQTAEFAEGTFPEDLTEAQKISAMQAYVKGATFISGLNEKQKALNYAGVIKGIDTGDIKTPADILGHDISAIQGEQAQAYLRKKNAKENKGQINLNASLKAVQAGGGQQDRLEPKQKDAVFTAMIEKLREERIEETGNENYQFTQQDLVQILKQMNTDVPWFNSKMDYALLRADGKTEAPDIHDALALGRQLQDTPGALKGLTVQSRSILNMVNSALLSAKNPDMENLMKGARVAANPDDPTKQAYAKRWQGLSEKDKQKLYKSVFDDNPETNIETYGQFKNMLELYNGSSDTMANAIESVRQEMTPVYGKDRFFEPGKNGYLPSSTAVPFSEVGQWYHNQIYLYFYGLTKRQKEATNFDATEKLEWVYGDVPKDLTENKLMHDNLHLLAEQAYHGSRIESAGAATLKAKWRGELVDIHYKADGMSRIGDNERVKYVFYFKDKEGGTHYILDPKSKDGSGFWVEYPSSLSEFLPNVFNEYDDNKFDDLMLESYKAERAAQKGTRKGTIKNINIQKEERISELREEIKKQKQIVPELKKKRTTPNLVTKLLEESS